MISNRQIHVNQSTIKLRKGKAPRKYSLHGKIAASVVLKLFISVMNDFTPLTPPSA